MASLTINNPNTIEFANLSPSVKDSPTLNVQCGEWESSGSFVAGVVFDVLGARMPLLSAHDARKLAKWLNRAADTLDGVKNSGKKGKSRRHYEEADDVDEY